MKGWVDLGSTSGFEHGTAGLGFQCLKHQTIGDSKDDLKQITQVNHNINNNNNNNNNNNDNDNNNTPLF